MFLSSILATAFLSVLSSAQACSDTKCCSILEGSFPGNTHWPNTATYVQEAYTSFWSNTSRLHPACVFTPESAEAVSEAIQLFEQHNCQFAVRGGGHMPHRSAANINNGVLIANTKLDDLSLHDGYVSVGAGLRWGAVFDYLETEGLAVVGGRVADVGVAGLILGGGLSTFSGKRGFACDNVKAFQIVVAGGHILEASNSSHANLFWALKGGSSNFGIVTRFDLYTHHDYRVYTGAQSLGMEHFDELAVAIDDFTRLSGENIADDMAIAPKIQWVPIYGPPEIVLSLGSTVLPAPGDLWSNRTGPGLALPPGLSYFADLPYNNSASTGMRVLSIAEQLKSTDTPSGLRYELRVVSFRSSVDMLIGMKNIFEEEFEPVFTRVMGFSGVIEIQPITKLNVREGYSRGGNAMGITEDRAPMIWAVMANSWLNAEDDEVAQAAGQRVVDRTQELARTLGLYEPFLFLNDAGVGQDPIATYGEEYIRELNKVKSKYDKVGTFDRLLPGGFKLPRQ